jgi:transposase InsO family protein
MSQAISPSVNKPYGLARVCRAWDISRSTVYDRRKQAERAAGGLVPAKRGPKENILTDEELLERIRTAIENSPWVGEGYRKVWARLRMGGVRTSPRRVLRLMRENDLLAPTRLGNARGSKAHDGTIVTETPDEMWGTDATSALTGEGNAGIFFVTDHCTSECLGIYAAIGGNRFDALEAVRQAVRSTRGGFEEGIAEGTSLRHDHGSQFISHAYQDELRFLGIESSPAFVREPEGNGCAERFVRTLKEQVLWIRRFETVDELNAALQEFKDRYNEEWLIERHGHISPSAKRRELAA